MHRERLRPPRRDPPGGCPSPSRTRARPPFFGVNVPGASPTAFDDLADELGVRPTVSSIFIKLDSSNALDGLAAIPAGVTPFVTLEPWSRTGRRGEVDQPRYSLRSLIDGAHDQALRKVAAALVALHRPVYLRFAHEMNGNWYPWSAAVNGNDPELYVQAWPHVHRIIGAITGPAVRWVWSPNITTGLPRGMPSLRSVYPGNEWVDYVGVTGYSRGPSPHDTFCPTLSALAAFSDKPVVLSEIGVDGPDELPWLENLGTFLSANPAIAGFVYFNTSTVTTGASGNYPGGRESRVAERTESGRARSRNVTSRFGGDRRAELHLTGGREFTWLGPRRRAGRVDRDTIALSAAICRIR